MTKNDGTVQVGPSRVVEKHVVQIKKGTRNSELKIRRVEDFDLVREKVKLNNFSNMVKVPPPLFITRSTKNNTCRGEEFCHQNTLPKGTQNYPSMRQDYVKMRLGQSIRNWKPLSIPLAA